MLSKLSRRATSIVLVCYCWKELPSTFVVECVLKKLLTRFRAYKQALKDVKQYLAKTEQGVYHE
jgi:hypothetical protein